MQIQVQNLGNKTFKANVKATLEDVNEVFKEAVQALKSQIKIDGFRQGKAPENIIKEKLDPHKVAHEATSLLAEKAFNKILKENHLKPITNPKVDLSHIDEGKEVEFNITIVEYPEIELGNYKEEIAKLKKVEEKDKEKDKTGVAVKTDEIIKVLLKTCKIGVSEILIQEEVSRMLSNLIDQTGRLGMTVESYLKSVNKDIETIKKEYSATAMQNISLEFILIEIAKKDGIKIDDKEIDNFINANPDQKSREEIKKEENRLYITSILLKNKVLVELSKLVK